MRLIDADALIDSLNIRSVTYNCIINKCIEDAPTIDAVPVVRCGECKHMIEDGRCMEFADDGIRPSATDFCSYGERREDGEA